MQIRGRRALIVGASSACIKGAGHALSRGSSDATKVLRHRQRAGGPRDVELFSLLAARRGARWPASNPAADVTGALGSCAE
jgi:hypothetical protein